MKHERHTSVRSVRVYLAPMQLLLLVLMVLLACCAREKSAYVRVNQVGYEAGSSMRAYFMTAGSPPGGSFVIESSHGDIAFTAPIGAKLGTWGDYNVYALDFTLSVPDTYKITVSRDTPIQSPKFRVDSAEQLYSSALANVLSFYQNQRDGADYIHSALRPSPAHLNDQRAKVYHTPEFTGTQRSRIKGDLSPTGAVIDASGGWWDAGDCLKFVSTHSTALAYMLIGIRDFPKQMGTGSSNANFTNEAKFGLDWLQRMWDDKSRTLYYQVGIGSWNWHYENDHSVWRLPQEDDTFRGDDPHYRYIRNRPVLIAAPAGSKISPNLGGRLAGVFALCYVVFRSSDKNYANQCLLAAEHIFDMADTAPAGELLTTAPHDFYPESDWRDDLEFAATELYFATRMGDLPGNLPHVDPRFYLRAAANWANAYMHSSEDTHDFTYMDHVGQFELWRAIGVAGNPADLAVSRADLENDIRTKLESASAVAGRDPFGSAYITDQGEYTFQAARISAMASEYEYMVQSKKFAPNSRQWLGTLLGANAWGSSFIVGVGSTFPHCVHHQVANLAGSHDGRAPILAGAMVSGPNGELESGAPSGVQPCTAPEGNGLSNFDGNGVHYRDSVKFYSIVEPAIDFTSSSLLMFAWRAAGAPSDLGTVSEGNSAGRK